MPENERPRQGIAEAALLITCLRGLSFVIPHDTDWQVLLELASENGVLLLIDHSLPEKGAEIPRFFATAVRESRDVAELFAAELENLLGKFAERGIDTLPLKGPVLAEVLYGDVEMRSCNDLDLLVRRKDFPQAEALLFELGFVACSEASDHDRKFIRHGVPVELHFTIASPQYFPCDLEGVWRRARKGTFRGHPIYVMSDDDLVLFLCLHGLKHGFSRLIWILDVARALEKVEDCDYVGLAQRARRQGLELWLLIGCEMVREMFPQYWPREVEAVIAHSPQTAERARRVAARLLVEGLEVVNGPEYRSFYLQTERSAIQRWRQRLSFFAPTGEDYAWARHHRIHHGLAPAIRPFRLLQKYGLSRVWWILFPPPI